MSAPPPAPTLLASRFSPLASRFSLLAQSIPSFFFVNARAYTFGGLLPVAISYAFLYISLAFALSPIFSYVIPSNTTWKGSFRIA